MVIAPQLAWAVLCPMFIMRAKIIHAVRFLNFRPRKIEQEVTGLTFLSGFGMVPLYADSMFLFFAMDNPFDLLAGVAFRAGQGSDQAPGARGGGAV